MLERSLRLVPEYHYQMIKTLVLGNYCWDKFIKFIKILLNYLFDFIIMITYIYSSKYNIIIDYIY